MRHGQNPAKMGLPAYQPKRLGLAILSWIPAQNGYFAQSMEILKYQIASIHRSTQDFDLLVFDNGSCAEVQDELHRLQAAGLIDFLVLSRFNLGKTGALNWILASLQNELIGYADGDVLFRPGWLEQTERIFQAFPTAGLVTAQPCLFDILRGTGKAHLSLKEDARYRCFEENLAPEAVEEYVRGTGLEAEQAEALKNTPVSFVEERSSGARAVIGASHMQFILQRETARALLPLPAAYALSTTEDASLNRSIDEMGLLHLSTLLPLVYHMGNSLDEYTLAEIRRMDLEQILQQPAGMKRNVAFEIKASKWRAFRVVESLSRWSFLRKAFQRLYHFLFEFYAQKK